MPVVVDRYGLPHTSHSAEAVAAYFDAVDRIRAFEPGAESLLEHALALDPRFTMAHVAVAGRLQLDGQVEAAREAMARASAMTDGLTDWEKQHIAVRALSIEGSPRAYDAALAHLREYPRDAGVLIVAGTALSFSPRLDKREVRLELIEQLAPQYGDDWWFLSQRAWANQECDRLETARRLAEQSLEQRPRAGQAVHSLAHVFYETDDHPGGSAFLDGWLADADRTMPFYCHFNWHLALAELALGHYGRVQEIYEAHIQPEVVEGTGRRGLTDSASLLWRLELNGCGWDGMPWSDVCTVARRITARPGMAFNDMHAALAFAATGDDEALAALNDGLRALEAKGNPLAGELMLPLVQGIGAFGHGDYQGCARLLEPLLDRVIGVGGSNAQREVVQDTVLEAYLRAEDYDRAEALLRQRLDRRPSARDARWLAYASSQPRGPAAAATL